MNLPHASHSLLQQPCRLFHKYWSNDFLTTSHPAFPTSMRPLPAALPVPKNTLITTLHLQSYQHLQQLHLHQPTTPKINFIPKMCSKNSLQKVNAAHYLCKICPSDADRKKLSRAISGILQHCTKFRSDTIRRQASARMIAPTHSTSLPHWNCQVGPTKWTVYRSSSTWSGTWSIPANWGRGHVTQDFRQRTLLKTRLLWRSSYRRQGKIAQRPVHYWCDANAEK